jgi:hypothetical protein
MVKRYQRAPEHQHHGAHFLQVYQGESDEEWAAPTNGAFYVFTPLAASAAADSRSATAQHAERVDWPLVGKLLQAEDGLLDVHEARLAQYALQLGKFCWRFAIPHRAWRRRRGSCRTASASRTCASSHLCAALYARARACVHSSAEHVREHVLLCVFAVTCLACDRQVHVI